MGGQHGIGGTYKEPFDARPIAYNVTGTLSPNSTCNYRAEGTYGGVTYYKRIDGAWFIWYRSGNQRWYITQELGNYNIIGWVRTLPNIVGDYNVINGASGIAHVSTGAH
jgi:hypothetical protein